MYRENRSDPYLGPVKTLCSQDGFKIAQTVPKWSQNGSRFSLVRLYKVLYKASSRNIKPYKVLIRPLKALISPHNRPHNTGTGRCNTYYTLKGLERAPPYTTQALLIEQSKEPEKQRIQHVCFSFVVGNTKGQHEFTISELNLAQHELTISELNLAWQGPTWAHYTYTYIIHIIH